MIPRNRPRLVTAVNSKFVPTLFSFFKPITIKARVFFRLCIIFKNYLYVEAIGNYYRDCPVRIDLRKSLIYVGSNPKSKSFGVWREDGRFHKITTEGRTNVSMACERLNFENFGVPRVISRRKLHSCIVETYIAFEIGKKSAPIDGIFNCWSEICSVYRVRSDRFGFVSLGHGDFSPWNIVQDSGGQIIVFDWDDAFDAQPYLVDILNYIWIQYLVNGNAIAFLKGLVVCWRLRFAFENLHINSKILITNFAFLFHRRGLSDLGRRKLAVWATLKIIAVKKI